MSVFIIVFLLVTVVGLIWQNINLKARNRRQGETIISYSEKINELRRDSAAIKELIEHCDEYQSFLEGEYNDWDSDVNTAQEKGRKIIAKINDNW